MIEIPLSGTCAAMIDEEDEELVKQHGPWRALRQPHTSYAIARLPSIEGKQQTLYMHRLVMHARPGQVVMHADRNGLNNTRDNLRVREAASSAIMPQADRPAASGQGEQTQATDRRITEGER